MWNWSTGGQVHSNDYNDDNDQSDSMGDEGKCDSNGFNTTTNSTETNCKLIMYDQTYFRGKSVEIIDDTNDFNGINFDNAVASLKVVGNCCWVLSSNTNYHGESIFVNRNGLYKSGNDIKKIFYKASSARKI